MASPAIFYSREFGLAATREGPRTTFWVPSRIPTLWVEAAPWSSPLVA